MKTLLLLVVWVVVAAGCNGKGRTKCLEDDSCTYFSRCSLADLELLKKHPALESKIRNDDGSWLVTHESKCVQTSGFWAMFFSSKPAKYQAQHEACLSILKDVLRNPIQQLTAVVNLITSPLRGEKRGDTKLELDPGPRIQLCSSQCKCSDPKALSCRDCKKGCTQSMQQPQRAASTCEDKCAKQATDMKDEMGRTTYPDWKEIAARYEAYKAGCFAGCAEGKTFVKIGKKESSEIFTRCMEKFTTYTRNLKGTMEQNAFRAGCSWPVGGGQTTWIFGGCKSFGESGEEFLGGCRCANNIRWKASKAASALTAKYTCKQTKYLRSDANQLAQFLTCAKEKSPSPKVRSAIQQDLAKFAQEMCGNSATGTGPEEETREETPRSETSKPTEAEKIAQAKEILGLEGEVTQSTVSKAFKKKALLFHPDKLSAKPEKERKVAEEEFKKVNNARDLLITRIEEKGSALLQNN